MQTPVQVRQIIVGCGLLHRKLVLPAAVVVVLMVGTVAMHLEVGSPFEKSVPALSVSVL